MYFFRLRKYFLNTLLLELFCHILQQIQADILSTQRKNRNAYTFRFPAERETGFEPATPTLARLYSTPEPLAHFSFFILLSARCTLQMILYRNSPHLSTPIFNFFQKIEKYPRFTHFSSLPICHNHLTPICHRQIQTPPPVLHSLPTHATTTSRRSATGRYRPPSRPQSQTLGVIGRARRHCGAKGIEKESRNCECRMCARKWDEIWCTTPDFKTH